MLLQFAGELVGVLWALATAPDDLWSKDTIVIFTDNQAAITAVQDPARQSGQNILIKIFSFKGTRK